MMVWVPGKVLAEVLGRRFLAGRSWQEVLATKLVIKV
jgi:hypothetical protein